MTARHAGLPGTLGSFIGMISPNVVASLLTPFLCIQRSTIVPETVGQCKRAYMPPFRDHASYHFPHFHYEA